MTDGIPTMARSGGRCRGPSGRGRVDANGYSHAFGFGHFKFFEIAKLARDKNGKCDTNPNHPPVSFFGKVTASGKATVGKQ